MISLSTAQMNEFAKLLRGNYVVRLAKHLAKIRTALSPVAARILAERAMDVGTHHKLGNEDEIAILAEVMLEFGADFADLPAWTLEVLSSERPDKARRLRECLAIERRLAKAGG